MISLKQLLKEEVEATPPAIIRPAADEQSQEQAEKAILAAATLWHEARGEGKEGMQAVLNVIMNRAGGKFDEIDKIILKPKQFSCWNSVSDPKTTASEMAQKASDGKLSDSQQFKEAAALVKLAIDGKLSDITGSAKYYFNPKLAKPKWAEKLTKTKSIGNHDFYK